MPYEDNKTESYSREMLDLKFMDITKQIDNLSVTVDENHKETLKKIDERIDLSDRRSNDKHKENSDRLQKIEQQTALSTDNISSLKSWRNGLGMCLLLITVVIIPLVVYSFQLSEQNLKQSILLNIDGITFKK